MSYDVIVEFKTKALEILDMDNKYFGAVYIMNLTKEAGFGVIKSNTGFNVMETLAKSVHRFTAKALAISFVGVEIGTENGRPAIKGQGLLLICVVDGVFSAWKCLFDLEQSAKSESIVAGPWMNITKGFAGIGEEEIMMKIFRDSNFELSAAEVAPKKIMADITII